MNIVQTGTLESERGATHNYTRIVDKKSELMVTSLNTVSGMGFSRLQGLDHKYRRPEFASFLSATSVNF